MPHNYHYLFLIFDDSFVENGNYKDIFMKSRNEYKTLEFRDTSDVEDETERKTTVRIPWIPKVSTKFT